MKRLKASMAVKWLNFINTTYRSMHTRYWSIHDVQRYFVGDLHCEQILFTCQYPNLRMPTLHGSYLWRANTATKIPPKLYLKEFAVSMATTLKVTFKKNIIF